MGCHLSKCPLLFACDSKRLYPAILQFLANLAKFFNGIRKGGDSGLIKNIFVVNERHGFIGPRQSVDCAVLGLR